jgi:anthraniloyl-CoA monooxygenase
MTRADLDKVVSDFVAGAERAERAGFDLIELHMAHGYLLSSFLSPLSNRRTDAYGGSLEHRLRFPLEVLDAVRATWPAGKPLFVRISATDWMPDGSGVTEEEAVDIARALAAHGCDVVDVSSGGTSMEGKPVYGRMYQVPFADRIRHEAGVPVMAVGGIEGVDHANTILAAGRADLCAIARPHLFDPYLALHGAAALGFPDAPWPPQYLRSSRALRRAQRRTDARSGGRIAVEATGRATVRSRAPGVPAEALGPRDGPPDYSERPKPRVNRTSRFSIVGSAGSTT